MKPLYRPLLIGLLAGTLAACSDDGGTSSTAPGGDDDPMVGVPVDGVDPGVDNPFDTPTDADTDGDDDPVIGVPVGGVDPDTDVTPEPGTDPDTGVTPDPDADTGTDSDATPDADTDADLDVTPDPETDPGMDVDSGNTPDPDTGTDTNVTPDTDADTGSDSDVTPDPGTDSDATPDPDPDTGTDTDSDATPDPDTGTDTDSDVTSDPGTDSDATPDPDTGTGTDSGTGSDSDATPDTDTDTGTDSGTPPAMDAGVGTVTAPRPGPATDPTGVAVTLTTVPENDCEGRELGIYVRTLSEACSVKYGVSRRDGSRTDEAPSAPTGLTALLVADNWIEIDWIPSSDDGEVVSYEIYRDGNLVRTLDQTPDELNPIHEQRDLRTTSYIDCNFTKNPSCFRESQSFGPVGQPSGSPTYTVVAIDDAGNRSDPSAPASFRLNVVDPNGTPPDLAAEGYELVFEDEFDGDRLDRDHWVTNLSFPQFGANGRAVNGAQQYYVDILGRDVGFAADPFVFTGDTLQITAMPTPPELRDEARGQPYLSGSISTRTKVPGFKYGYVEMNAKVPSGSGLLSTFFLFQPTGNQYEIDILEYLGRVPDGATQNYHYRDGFRFSSNGIVVDGVEFDNGNQGVAHASPTMFLDTGTDLSDDFRTYAVLWEPGLIVYYVDGREVRRLSGPRVADVPMDIVAQLTVGIPSFTGDPVPSSFPGKYEIDYMRVYQK